VASTDRDVDRTIYRRGENDRNGMRDAFDSDLAIYAGTSVVTTVVFLAVLFAVVAAFRLDLSDRTLAGFVVGYAIATLVYYTAYEVYQYVDTHEQPVESREQ
jgi:hypothetical protein